MFPSWRPRISVAVGLYLRRFSSSVSASSFNRACESASSFAVSVLLWCSVPLMMLRKNRVLGLALLAGLEAMHQRPRGESARMSSLANLEPEGDEV